MATTQRLHVVCGWSVLGGYEQIKRCSLMFTPLEGLVQSASSTTLSTQTHFRGCMERAGRPKVLGVLIVDFEGLSIILRSLSGVFRSASHMQREHNTMS